MEEAGIMVRKIGLEKYRGMSDVLVGETMEVRDDVVTVFIAREKFGIVRPGVFLIVSSGDGGLIGLVGTKISKTKYGGEFTSVVLDFGEDAEKMYGDLENEYLYTVDIIPIYEVDGDGRVKPFFSLIVKPHQPVYLLEEDDVKAILYDGDLDLSFLLYVKLDDYILCRNLFLYLYETLRDVASLDTLLYEFLSYAYRNGSSLEIVVNVFKEVEKSVG